MEEGDLIAKRTRSQLPLQDVPIESIEGIPGFTADWILLPFFGFCTVKIGQYDLWSTFIALATFQPPDFTADMYDTVQEDDLDFEDIEWQKWLQGLINSGVLHYWIWLSKISWFVTGKHMICQSWMLRQIINLQNTEKSWNFAFTEFKKCFITWSLSLVWCSRKLSAFLQKWTQLRMSRILHVFATM